MICVCTSETSQHVTFVKCTKTDGAAEMACGCKCACFVLCEWESWEHGLDFGVRELVDVACRCFAGLPLFVNVVDCVAIDEDEDLATADSCPDRETDDDGEQCEGTKQEGEKHEGDGEPVLLSHGDWTIWQ